MRIITLLYSVVAEWEQKGYWVQKCFVTNKAACRFIYRWLKEPNQYVITNDNDSKLKTTGVKQKEERWHLTGGLQGALAGDLTSALGFEDVLGVGGGDKGGVELSFGGSRSSGCIWGKR